MVKATIEGEEQLYEDTRWGSSIGPGDILGGLVPVIPIPPLPEPPAILIAYNYEQLRTYRLQNAPYIVRAHYDVVQWMIEDGIMRKHEKDYQEWLVWVKANL